MKGLEARDPLDGMWQAGYCDEAIVLSSTTTLDQRGSTTRLEWLAHHVPGCRDCRYANCRKHLNEVVAEQLGIVQYLHLGGDVTTHPDFEDAMAKVIEDAIASGQIESEFSEWTQDLAMRRGRPWPGHSG
jgi:hypothetical protein